MSMSIRRTPEHRKITMVLLILAFAVGSGSLKSAFGQALQRIEIPSSFNPVGQGARALGMGGAFIAVADDATAASWNPGGLVQLERPEFSIVGAGFHRTEDLDFGANPEASGDQNYSKSRINYFSITYPFTLFGLNMVVSGNWQNLYDLTREWNFPLRLSDDELSVVQDIDYDQQGSLGAWGLAYALQISPTLSLGITFNLWEDGLDDNRWKQEINQSGSGQLAGNPFNFNVRSTERYNFSGWNLNLGLLWNVTGRLTIGGVLKTPFTADLDRKVKLRSAITFPDSPDAGTSASDSYSEHEDLNMPLSFGLGFAYRLSDELTMSLDVYRTNWQNFELEDSDGNKISPITGKPADESDVDPTYQVRLGGEYLFIRQNYVIPLRAGLFYDPAPAEGSPDDYFGFSLGSGVGVGRFIFDIAYQYRFGRDVNRSILESLDFSEDVDEHAVYASVIIHF